MFRMTVLTCLWKRREVAEIMLDNLVGLQDALRDQVAIDVLAVGSEGDASRSIVEARGFHYLEYENQPLGAKWNAGLRACVKLEPDAVVILGSDNIVNDRMFIAWAQKIRHGYDYVGFLDGFMIDAHSKIMVRWHGYKGRRQNEPLGSGRCYSRQLLGRMKWVLWNSSLASGLDYSVTLKLNAMKGVKAGAWMMNVHGIKHLGIKTPDNICKFQSLIRNSAGNLNQEDPTQLRVWYEDGGIGDRILDLDLAPPAPEPVVDRRRARAMAQTIDELIDTVICPRCLAVTKTARVITCGELRPGEEFICQGCATVDEEAKERARAAALPLPSNFLPQVSSSTPGVQSGGEAPPPVPGGGDALDEVQGGKGAGEFKPGGG